MNICTPDTRIQSAAARVICLSRKRLTGFADWRVASDKLQMIISCIINCHNT